MLLDKGSLAIAQICSDSDTRYALSGVLVERDRLIATDGRMLAIVLPPETKWADEVPLIEGVNPIDPEEFVPFIMPASFVERLRKQLPTGKKQPRGTELVQLDTAQSAEPNEAGVRSIVAGVTDLETRQVLRANECDGRFPSTDEVVPAGEIHASVAIGFPYLEKLYKVMLAIRKAEGVNDHATLVIDIPKASYNEKDGVCNGPVIVRAPDGPEKNRFLGVLMPVSVGDDPKGCTHTFTQRGAHERRILLNADHERSVREARERQLNTEATVKRLAAERAAQSKTE